MADIPRKVRSKNSHEPNNFTLGHFGKPEYDDSREEWRFLRSGRQQRNEDVNSSLEGWPAVELLHSQLVLPGSATVSPHDAPYSGATSTSAHRPLRSQYETRLALSSVTPEEIAKRPPHNTFGRPSMVLGYAWSPYEVRHHIFPVPIVVVACPGEHVLRTHLMKHTGDGSEAEQSPLVDKEQSVVAAPLREPVLGLSFSADKHYLAIRQRSGTSIVVAILDEGRSTAISFTGPDIRLDHIVTLPNANTGGYLHADVAFHPKDHNLLGIVDEHGNWSAWQLKGRKSTTSRVLYTIRLRSCGKLLPSATNLKLFGKDVYFDGWHKICCLSVGQEANVLLVCSRRVARTYWSNGTARGDADMRLGAPSAKNWVLDIQSSLQQPAVCYILTSTRILVMRLSDDEEREDELDLLCSWAHFRARGDMSLRLDVVETGSVTGFFLCSDCAADLSVYWISWTQAGEVASAADPQLLPIPQTLPQSLDTHRTYRVEVIQVSGTLTKTGQSPGAIFVKFLAALSDGSLYIATYSCTSANVSPSDQTHAGHIMKLPQLKEWHFKSARVVSEEDDLLDFVVPDRDVVSWRAREEKESPLRLGGQPSGKTRNWEDLIHFEVNEGVTLEDALRQLDSAQKGLSHGQTHLQTMSELLPEIHIADVAETATTMSVWQTGLQRKANPSIVARYLGTFDAAVGSFVETYQNVGDVYVKDMPRELPERARVQTERLSRNVAFDQYMSSLTERIPQGDLDAEDLPEMESLLLSSPQPMASEEDTASPLAVLQRYTSIPRPPVAGLASKTVSTILAHLPYSDLTDPNSYSYKEVEERLKEQRTQEELDNLGARARRRAERMATRQEEKMARQQRLRNEATQQSTAVPSLVLSSPQRDPRQVQSSQPEAPAIGSSQPGLTMTQPERGAHGERRQAVKKGGKRRKGF